MSNLNAKATTPAIIWWGQVVDDSVWKENQPGKLWKYSDEIPGWGTRYKVRILGRDTEKKDVPDDQLEWAECSFPVTSGSGHAGSYQTSNLRKGAFVFGFYKDGTHMSEPIIIGCLSNNEQIQLSQSIPLKGFVPFSGYVKEKVSYNDIPAEGSIPKEKLPLEGNNNSTQNNIATQQQRQKGQQSKSLAVSKDCDPLQFKALQIEIKGFIQDIQKFKSQVKSWKNTVLKPIKENGEEYSISEYIQYKIQNVSKSISKKVKNIVTQVDKYITRKINNAAKDLYLMIPPNQRPGIKSAMDTVNDLLACLFRKIISNLLKMMTDILKAIADRFINAPLCAIQNIISSLLGKLMALITSAVEKIIKPLEALIGGIFDAVGGVLDFITDLLSFLSCDDQPQCPDSDEWVPWEGSKKLNLGSSVNNIISQANSIASNAQKVVDPDNFNFNLDFSDIFQDTCNVGPLFCGPPTVEFYGGGGSGAAGNAIVSATGDILGVDLRSLGSGYQSAPFVNFVDACGKGQGATGRAIINSNGQVIKVIMDNPGFGYLSAPNGDQGGDGRTWAKSGDTIVKRKDGTYDQPYEAGETFQVSPGDTVYSCGNTTNITESATLTAPKCSTVTLPRGEDPSLNNGQYPTVLELDSIAIDTPGINYGPKDKMIITPNNGAELRPKYDALGSLIKVDVVKPGIGFTEYPSIEIETETGYNAVLLPVFKVNRVGDAQDVPVAPSQIISVVDCVGKF